MASDHTIDGRMVDVKRALPRDKAPGPTRLQMFGNFISLVEGLRHAKFLLVDWLQRSLKKSSEIISANMEM